MSLICNQFQLRQKKLLNGDREREKKKKNNETKSVLPSRPSCASWVVSIWCKILSISLKCYLTRFWTEQKNLIWFRKAQQLSDKIIECELKTLFSGVRFVSSFGWLIFSLQVNFFDINLLKMPLKPTSDQPNVSNLKLILNFLACKKSIHGTDKRHWFSFRQESLCMSFWFQFKLNFSHSSKPRNFVLIIVAMVRSAGSNRSLSETRYQPQWSSLKVGFMIAFFGSGDNDRKSFTFCTVTVNCLSFCLKPIQVSSGFVWKFSRS